MHLVLRARGGRARARTLRQLGEVLPHGVQPLLQQHIALAVLEGRQRRHLRLCGRLRRRARCAQHHCLQCPCRATQLGRQIVHQLRHRARHAALCAATGLGLGRRGLHELS